MVPSFAMFRQWIIQGVVKTKDDNNAEGEEDIYASLGDKLVHENESRD
jgi:hypothetical protein